jgi:benzoate 4-monooxygenase
MAHSFSQASLTKMEHIFDRHIMKLVDTIHAQGDRSFDLKDLLAYYTYDLMGELIFNADFGSQDAGDPEVLPRIQDHIWLGCIYGMLPSLLPYSMRFSSWIPFPWLQDKLRSRNALRDKTASHVSFELARGKDSERQNILNRLVHAKDPETGEGLPEAAIRSEAFGFLIAGSHTTSDSLTLLFYHLLHNSEAARKLSEEIRGANMASTGNLSTFSGLEQQLPYMTACLRESFRITPVFTMPLPRKVMQPEGMEIDGLHVPAGVGHNNSYVLHLYTNLFRR